MATTVSPDGALEIAPGVHWVGTLDPTLRSFDIILKTANGTSYNSYVVRGSDGVAVIDTVKENFADTFFRRLEAVPMVEDRLRGLKLRVPVKGLKAKLIPTAAELASCHALGRDLALHLTGRAENRIIDMAALA